MSLKIKINLNILIVALLLGGILGSIFIEVSIRDKRKRARDNIRKSDLMEIQKGLETFFVDYSQYPEKNNLQKRLVPNYLKELPRDPKDLIDYEYAPLESPPKSYQLKTILENKNDSDPRIKNGYFILQSKQ